MHVYSETRLTVPVLLSRGVEYAGHEFLRNYYCCGLSLIVLQERLHDALGCCLVLDTVVVPSLLQLFMIWILLVK
jgi:hypothetical protein